LSIKAVNEMNKWYFQLKGDDSGTPRRKKQMQISQTKEGNTCSLLNTILMILALFVFSSVMVCQSLGQSAPIQAKQAFDPAKEVGKSNERPSPSAAKEPLEKSPGTNTKTIEALKTMPEFKTLMPFGYEFFRAATMTNDRGKIPAPMQYRIGPEDTISLDLGGSIKARYELKVDRNGKISIPGMGSVFVAGMTFEEMSKRIIKKSEETIKVNVDITMNALKTIPVYVRGEVRRPGMHTVGAFATITDVLLFTGGLKKTGSVRNIQVRRKGITVAVFDLYDFLLNGEKYKDIILITWDEIFVPIKGPMVGIIGSVRHPAIYEVKHHYGLENLIGLAGGVIATTKAWRIQVERIVGNERKIIYDVNEQEIQNSIAPSLKDRDLVRISPIAK
jgi:polysaccharide biosynthesis/export protein